MTEAQAYPQDQRVLRAGGNGAPSETGAPQSPDNAEAAQGLVGELRPYLPRMALGGALVLLAQLWWAAQSHRRRKRRERKRRGRRWF